MIDRRWRGDNVRASREARNERQSVSGRGPLAVGRRAAPGHPKPPSAASEGGGLLAMIERLATNPQLNVEVFDRLLAARREEEDRAAERAFNPAMSDAKGELTTGPQDP